MPKVSIELPPVDTDDKVEVELTINGRKRKMTYRIEIFHWEDYAEPDDDRVTCLKRMIENYEEGWRLVQIGVPNDTDIPVTFQQDEVGTDWRSLSISRQRPE